MSHVVFCNVEHICMSSFLLKYKATFRNFKSNCCAIGTEVMLILQYCRRRIIIRINTSYILALRHNIKMKLMVFLEGSINKFNVNVDLFQYLIKK